MVDNILFPLYRKSYSYSFWYFDFRHINDHTFVICTYNKPAVRANYIPASIEDNNADKYTFFPFLDFRKYFKT